MKIEAQTLILTAIVVVAAIILAAWVAKHFFSDEARWERRRRRSNAPIASRGNRTTVRFSVNLKKRKKR
jgi:hypothetical protein